MAREEPTLKRLLVVTSPPHNRRSGLCFRRSLRDDVRLQVYSATELRHTAEIHWPIWIEYAKLVAYLVFA